LRRTSTWMCGTTWAPARTNSRYPISEISHAQRGPTASGSRDSCEFSERGRLIIGAQVSRTGPELAKNASHCGGRASLEPSLVQFQNGKLLTKSFELATR
jgi:hypothetical protein